MVTVKEKVIMWGQIEDSAIPILGEFSGVTFFKCRMKAGIVAIYASPGWWYEVVELWGFLNVNQLVGGGMEKQCDLILFIKFTYS